MNRKHRLRRDRDSDEIINQIIIEYISLAHSWAWKVIQFSSANCFQDNADDSSSQHPVFCYSNLLLTNYRPSLPLSCHPFTLSPLSRIISCLLVESLQYVSQKMQLFHYDCIDFPCVLFSLRFPSCSPIGGREALGWILSVISENLLETHQYLLSSWLKSISGCEALRWNQSMAAEHKVETYR